MVWLKWIILITLSYIIFIYLVAKFLTGIRYRYKNLNREKWNDDDYEQTNSLPQEGRPSINASTEHCNHATRQSTNIQTRPAPR